MSEPLQREWRFYVTDMIGFAEKVVVYTEGMDQDKFVASGLTCPGSGSHFRGRDSLEADRCHAQSSGAWLSGNQK